MFPSLYNRSYPKSRSQMLSVFLLYIYIHITILIQQFCNFIYWFGGEKAQHLIAQFSTQSDRSTGQSNVANGTSWIFQPQMTRGHPFTNHSPTIHQPFTNHSPTIHQPFTNHSPITMVYSRLIYTHLYLFMSILYLYVYNYIYIHIKVFFKQQTLTSLKHHSPFRSPFRLAKATNIFFINAESVICDLLISSGEGSFDEDILGWDGRLGFYRFTRAGPLVFTYQKLWLTMEHLPFSPCYSWAIVWFYPAWLTYKKLWHITEYHHAINGQ